MNSLGIRQLRSFVTVAKMNNISGAASQIGRTQSAVSMQMRNLEEVVGGLLLRRTRRGTQLTKKGERLLTHALAILKLHDQALADLSGQTIVGDIRLGCPDDYASLLTAALSDFAAEYPLIQVQLVCAPTPDLIRSMDNYALDLKIVTVKRARKDQLLRREQLVWVGRAGSALIDHSILPLAVSHAESIDRITALKSLRRAKRDYRIVCASGSISGLLVAVNAGIAIAVLARSIVPKNLAILQDGLPQLPQVDVALVQASDRPTQALRHLAAHLRRELTIVG